MRLLHSFFNRDDEDLNWSNDKEKNYIKHRDKNDKFYGGQMI